jgi:hypothetical protein
MSLKADKSAGFIKPHLDRPTNVVIYRVSHKSCFLERHHGISVVFLGRCKGDRDILSIGYDFC